MQESRERDDRIIIKTTIERGPEHERETVRDSERESNCKQ
jgi:hypothetical protein